VGVTRENKMETEKVGRLLFGMAFPAIIAQVINVLYNIVDRMYIGHIPEIGADALTGVGVTMPLSNGNISLCRTCKHGRRSKGIHNDGNEGQDFC